MLRLRELSAPLPLASMPLSPWVDWEHLRENKNNDALVSREMAEYMAPNFLGEKGSVNENHRGILGLDKRHNSVSVESDAAIKHVKVWSNDRIELCRIVSHSGCEGCA